MKSEFGLPELKFDGTVMNKVPTKRQPTLGILGQLLDIRSFDPLDMCGSCKMRNVLNFDKLVYHPAPDYSVMIPEGVLFRPSSGGNATESTRIIESEREFKNFLSTKIGLNAGVPKVLDDAFSTSMSMSVFTRKKRKQKIINTYSEITVCLDTLSLDLHDGMPGLLSKSFLKDLDEINAPTKKKSPTEKKKPLTKKEQIEAFIDKWGTHFVVAVRFGGRASLMLDFDEYIYESELKQEAEFKLKVNALIKKIKVGGNTEIKNSFEKRISELSSLESKIMKFTGGTPNDNLYEWAQSVRDNPVAIETEIKYIYDLLTNSYAKRVWRSLFGATENTDLLNGGLDSFLDTYSNTGKDIIVERYAFSNDYIYALTLPEQKGEPIGEAKVSNETKLNDYFYIIKEVKPVEPGSKKPIIIKIKTWPKTINKVTAVVQVQFEAPKKGELRSFLFISGNRYFVGHETKKGDFKSLVFSPIYSTSYLNHNLKDKEILTALTFTSHGGNWQLYLITQKESKNNVPTNELLFFDKWQNTDSKIRIKGSVAKEEDFLSILADQAGWDAPRNICGDYVSRNFYVVQENQICKFHLGKSGNPSIVQGPEYFAPLL